MTAEIFYPLYDEEDESAQCKYSKQSNLMKKKIKNYNNSKETPIYY